jgi:hypothetical protein
MSTPNAGLILHLNFAEVMDRTLADLSDEGNDGTLQGNPQLVPDDTFGSCLSFDGASDYVSLPPGAAADFSQGLTFEAWALYDALASWSRVFDFGNGPDGDNLVLANQATSNNLVLQVYRGGNRAELLAEGRLKTGEWMHLAGTVDSSGAGVLYVNGEQAAAGPLQAPANLARLNNYIGKSNWQTDALFRGKVASVRVYNRALTADEVRHDMEDDKTAAAAFRASYPLNFKLYDLEDNQQVIYITDHPQGRQVSFEVVNTSRKAVTLAAPASPQVSPQNYHFELRLRAGTLSAAALSRLALAESGWSMLKPTQDPAAQNGPAVSLYFLSATERTLNPSDRITVTLSGVAADPGAGARGTRAELRFSQMGYPGEATPLTGVRIQHLNVVNQRGQKLIPLHVGFPGSNRVLNDGASQNTLRLRITNVSQFPLALTPAPGGAASRLVISFDTRGDTEAGKDWALGTASQVNGIRVTAQGWTPFKPEAQTPEWVLTTANASLAAGDAVEVTLDGIVTSLPSGMTNLYLRYENIPGHWDGQFVVPIEKSPVVYRGDNVGVGTATPQAKLSVRGGLHVGGESDPGAGNLHVDGKVGLGDSANFLQQGFSINFPSTAFRANSGGTIYNNFASTGIKIVTDGSGVLSTNQFDVLTWYDMNGIPEVVVYGKLWATEKNFLIDHPTRPGYRLVHSCIEGPEVGVYYRGSGRLSDGEATVRLPDYFEALTLKQDRTVMLTAKGREPYLLSYEEICNGEFKVYGTKPDGEFCWEVKAVRADVEHLQVEVRK